MKEKTEHDGVFLILRDDVHIYYNYFKPVVLKYDKKLQQMVTLRLTLGSARA